MGLGTAGFSPCFSVFDATLQVKIRCRAFSRMVQLKSIFSIRVAMKARTSAFRQTRGRDSER